MINKLLNGDKEEAKKALEIINNPFSKSSIERMDLHAYKNLFDDTVTIYGTVQFKNGGTEATQRIEADNLPELVIKMYEFCNSL